MTFTAIDAFPHIHIYISFYQLLIAKLLHFPITCQAWLAMVSGVMEKCWGFLPHIHTYISLYQLLIAKLPQFPTTCLTWLAKVSGAVGKCKVLFLFRPFLVKFDNLAKLTRLTHGTMFFVEA